jgi:hypothetical protein
VRLPVRARDLPGRITTGGYILHAGLEKWQIDQARADALHRMAPNAFPFSGALGDRRNGS